MNYSKETTQYICNEYKNEPSRTTVLRLSEELNKTPKSITGKLSKEGVYRRQPYMTKLGEIPITKVDLVHMIADNLEIEPEELTGLEKSPKGVLKLIENVTK